MRTCSLYLIYIYTTSHIKQRFKRIIIVFAHISGAVPEVANYRHAIFSSRDTGHVPSVVRARGRAGFGAAKTPLLALRHLVETSQDGLVAALYAGGVTVVTVVLAGRHEQEGRGRIRKEHHEQCRSKHGLKMTSSKSIAQK